MKLVLYLVVNTLAVLTASYILSGIDVLNIYTAVIVAILLGILNTLLKPLLILLTLPITLLTFGLFTFVINALLVLLISYVVPGFMVENFWWALAFSLVVSIVSSFLSKLLEK